MADTFTSEIDSSQWDALMRELTPRQLKSAWKSGIKQSAKVIERGVQSSLSAKHPNAVKYKKEIRLKIWSQGQGFTVNLSQGQIQMARSKSGKIIPYSHLYILRWLSGGTEPRRTHKDAYRGYITPSHFFAEGVNQSIDEATDSLVNNISNALGRAYSKAKAAKGVDVK